MFALNKPACSVFSVNCGGPLNIHPFSTPLVLKRVTGVVVAYPRWPWVKGGLPPELVAS